MSLQRVAAVISAVVLAGWAVTASAGGEYGRSGPYVGAGGVYAIENIDAPAGISSVDDSWGYNIKGGYRFNQIFALEAKWEQWLGFDY
ncbi:MAG: outer membrane beta-barrel protein, partial [Deltaproteobacteria bacterium]|nr:outer membrane beta-barrel protein [Deltaproteobacteria bacterium]